MKIAVVTPRNLNGEKGGAENLYEGLVIALKKAGHSAVQVEVLVDESSFEGILEAYSNCFYLDLDDYDLVVSTKAPTYMVRHRNHVSYLLHTIRVFYDMFDREFDPRDKEKQKERKLIREFDKHGLDPLRVKKHFVNGAPVYERMMEVDDFWKKVNFEVLHHPPKVENYREPQKGEIIFFPTRLHRWKRPDLIINAMKYVNHNIDLVISGRGEDERQYKELAKNDNRIKFVGWIDDKKLVELYSKSIVVPFVPINEDYGLITVEAYKSKKPVITCSDSGEPARIVKDGISGYVVEPDPKKIAEKINYLIENPEDARKMGEEGCKLVQDISWENVVSEILSISEEESTCCSFEEPSLPTREEGNTSHSVEEPKKVKVLVTDNQILDPPIGGGRVRIYELYKNFDPEIFDITYLGTFDWLGPEEREQKLADHFTEILVPMTVPHITIDKIISRLCAGKTTLDVTIPLLMKLTPKYQQRLNILCTQANVVIVSHPWVYPYVKKEIADMKEKPLLIYDSHNLEYNIKKNILNSTLVEKRLANLVHSVEEQLVKDSDLIFACSSNDSKAFSEVYGADLKKILLVPNGASINDITPVSADEKEYIKSQFGFENKIVAVFLASGGYKPNDDAAEYICKNLAPSLKRVTFVLVGSVCDTINRKMKKQLEQNVILMGVVSSEEKKRILSCSDFALNPVTQGSGTNVKVFDYLAAGLNIITTPVGARGIEFNNYENGIISELDEFQDSIQKLLDDCSLRDKISKNARLLAEKYDWNKISRIAGKEITNRVGGL